LIATSHFNDLAAIQDALASAEGQAAAAGGSDRKWSLEELVEQTSTK
jgi:hypothetical protein